MSITISETINSVVVSTTINNSQPITDSQNTLVLSQNNLQNIDIIQDTNVNQLIFSQYPAPHKLSHSIGGSDEITLQDIGAQPAGDYAGYPVEYSDLSNSNTVIENVKKRVAKAWINFNGTGTISIRSQFNISALIDNGIGDYTIVFAEPFGNTNYSFVTWSRDYNTDNTIINNLSARSNTTKTSSSLRLIFNNPINGLNYDSLECNIIVFGE